MAEAELPLEAVLFRLRQALGRLEQEVLTRTASHFGRTPKIVMFISVSDIDSRAVCATGVGNTMETAWRVALARLRKLLPDQDLWRWIKADIVHTVRSTSPSQALAEAHATRRNYFRHGIAFDPNFRTALLEQELHGIAAWVHDDSHQTGLSFKRINRYLKDSRQQSMLLEDVTKAEEWYLFDTHGFFTDRSGSVQSLMSDGHGQGIRESPAAAEDLVMLIENAGLYLARQMRADGSFIYGYFPAYGTIIPTYNILRHCGTLYSMLEAWEATGNSEIARRVPEGIDHVLRTAMLQDGERLYVVDHANHSEIKLGSQAVLILTLAKFTTLTGDGCYLKLARALAKGIIDRFLEPSTGAFVHVLDGTTLALKDQFRIAFYDGEGILALLRLYEIDRDRQWLEAARMAYEHLIHVEHWKHHDHWLAYCSNEITRYLPEERYFEFGLKNCFGNLMFIHKRETAYPTFLELLMASLLLIDTMTSTKSNLLGEYDLRALVETIDHRAEHQRFACFYPEIAMYFASPLEIVGSFFSRHHSFRTRIDDVEHFISGYCLYLHNVVRVRSGISTS